MCRAVALAYQVTFLFAFPLAFGCLLEFLLVVSFLFFFSLVTNHVCCKCTHQGGDSGQCVVRGPVDVLLGVMSD
jgi:hypothetical protein